MAGSTVLKLKFGTMNGTKTWSFKYADTDAAAASVQSLMNTMIENGSIYRYPPLTKESAELVTTITSPISVG